MFGKYKIQIIVGIAAVLVAAFVWGGDVPDRETNPPKNISGPYFATALPVFSENVSEPTQVPVSEEVSEATEIPTAECSVASLAEPVQAPVVTPSPTPVPVATTEPSPTHAITPEPVPTQRVIQIPPELTEVEPEHKDLICTVSVSCRTLLNNTDHFDKEKISLIPPDGIILPETEAEFYEGETVFNVLLREMKKHNIHLEFVNVPVYNSAYIEGIGNIYEFECGELSGWMYRVNGGFPNFGSSLYELKPGDRIEWLYTCDLGVDIGDTSGTRNGWIK